jgi:hypothetical protein
MSAVRGKQCIYCNEDYYKEDEEYPGACTECVPKLKQQAFLCCNSCNEVWATLNVLDSKLSMEIEAGAVYTTEGCPSCSTSEFMEYKLLEYEQFRRMVNLSSIQTLRPIKDFKTCICNLQSKLHKASDMMSVTKFNKIVQALAFIQLKPNDVMRLGSTLFWFIKEKGLRKASIHSIKEVADA